MSEIKTQTLITCFSTANWIAILAVYNLVDGRKGMAILFLIVASFVYLGAAFLSNSNKN